MTEGIKAYAMPTVDCAPIAQPGSNTISPRARNWLSGCLYFLLVCSATTIAGTSLATVILLVALIVIRPPLPYARRDVLRYLLPFWAFIAVILASALVQSDRALALREANEYRLLVFPLMFLFVWPHVNLRRVLQVLCIVAILAALYGVYQYMTHLDPLYWYRGGTGRARGGFTNALTYSGYMLLLSPLLLPLCWAEQTRWRWAWAAASTLAAVAVVLSQSRSGLVGLAAAAFVLLYRWKRSVAISAMGGALLVGVMVIGASGTLRTMLPPSDSSAGAALLRRFLIIEPLQDRSIRDRLLIWEAGVSGWLDRPVLGHGSGMHSHQLEPYQRAAATAHGMPDHAYAAGYNTSLHNMYVRMLFDLGIVGLIVYGWLWVSTLASIRDGLRHDPGTDMFREMLLWGLTASFVGLNAASLFEDNFFDSEVQTLALVLMTLAFHTARTDAPPQVCGSTRGRRPAPPMSAGTAPNTT